MNQKDEETKTTTKKYNYKRKSNTKRKTRDYVVSLRFSIQIKDFLELQA